MPEIPKKPIQKVPAPAPAPVPAAEKYEYAYEEYEKYETYESIEEFEGVQESEEIEAYEEPEEPETYREIQEQEYELEAEEKEDIYEKYEFREKEEIYEKYEEAYEETYEIPPVIGTSCHDFFTLIIACLVSSYCLSLLLYIFPHLYYCVCLQLMVINPFPLTKEFFPPEWNGKIESV